MMEEILAFIKNKFQDHINQRNRNRLTNRTLTIIVSNCTGGFLYHWLGLEFRSPFINLYMTPEDFLIAVENFEEFINTPIREYKNNDYDYPVGIGAYETKIHFMHYPSFDIAVTTWNKRCKRIDTHNICIIMSNWGGQDTKQLERFEKLPFKNKIVFTDREFPEYSSAFCLKGYDCKNGHNGNVYATQTITGKRYIDQFDYVSFFNQMK